MFAYVKLILFSLLKLQNRNLHENLNDEKKLNVFKMSLE